MLFTKDAPIPKQFEMEEKLIQGYPTIVRMFDRAKPMSVLDSRSVKQSDDELNRRVTEFIEGRGSQVSRRLTREMLKTFPSIIDRLSSEQQQRLQEVLRKEDF